MADSIPREKRSGADQFVMGESPALSQTVGAYAARRSAGIGRTGRSGIDQKDDLDTAWEAWNKQRTDENFQSLMTKTSPVIDKAITSYAPGSSPAIRSQAKILAKQAIETYDPKKGTKLKTHLMFQLQPLRREANSYETVHMPERVMMDRNALTQRNQEFMDKYGHEPSDAELADFSGLSRKRIEHLRQYDKLQVSEAWTRPTQERDIAGLPVVSGEPDIWADAVYESLGSIDQRIYDMKIGRKTGKPLTVNEIAVKMKMTPSAVSQRLKKISDTIAEGRESA